MWENSRTSTPWMLFWSFPQQERTMRNDKKREQGGQRRRTQVSLQIQAQWWLRDLFYSLFRQQDCSLTGVFLNNKQQHSIINQPLLRLQRGQWWRHWPSHCPAQQAQDPQGTKLHVCSWAPTLHMANGPSTSNRKSLFSGLGWGKTAEQEVFNALLWYEVKAFFQSKWQIVLCPFVAKWHHRPQEE